MDTLLVEREKAMAASARNLSRSLTVLYKQRFLADVLQLFCERLAEARSYAARGDSRQAGVRYQSLLVISQVLQLHMAYAELSEQADALGQPSFHIAGQMDALGQDMAPMVEAAESLDSRRLATAMPEGVRRYNAWLAHLDKWASSLKLGYAWWQRTQLALDVAMLAVSAYDLAIMACDGAGMGPPPLVGITPGGAAVVGHLDLAAALEAIRKLVTSGALDPVVVAGLSAMNPQSAGSFAMGGKPLPNMANVKKINGRWPINSEHAGHTYPIENLPEPLRTKYPKSVRFDEEGFPDFRPYATKEVKVRGLTGDKTDFTRANQAAGLQETPSGYSWHHHQDGLTMQLVPTELHFAVRHTGGAAILEAASAAR